MFLKLSWSTIICTVSNPFQLTVTRSQGMYHVCDWINSILLFVHYCNLMVCVVFWVGKWQSRGSTGMFGNLMAIYHIKLQFIQYHSLGYPLPNKTIPSTASGEGSSSAKWGRTPAELIQEPMLGLASPHLHGSLPPATGHKSPAGL